MANLYPIRPGEADCRDYLRTGRCKYGESCKYNHPPNVESGGGVKPLNPGEPLFPIRPTEPPCQYFLKHGTCKFGQSCKFNHPSGTPLSDGSGGLPAGQLVFVTTNAAPGAMPGDSSLMPASTSVQVLPQRPTEPNCIYFLRNGKCKYGATCKFHHPLDAINRNNQQHQQVQHMQGTATNLRPTNARDRSASTGSMSDHRSQMQQQQHGLTYAAAANVSYVQPQRLQPITERVPRPQQPTHILLPDGQIAVILDPQSLQNVNELSAQDRPKFYLSQTDGSIGTLPSIDPGNNPNLVTVSPMLTATTNSTSNNTFDSSIDLGTNLSYQGQQAQESHRGPHKSGSGGSLSAIGSLDSGSHAMQGDYSQQVSSQLPSQQMPLGMGQASSSFPQYSAWTMNEGVIGQSSQSQGQARRSSPGISDALDGRQQRHVASLESTAENTAYYWPSAGSFPSIPAHEQESGQVGSSYPSMPNSSQYLPNSAMGSQNIHRSYSAERVSPSASSEQRIHGGRRETNRRSQESSGGDDEGLTMMTSALLTMMDHHESPTEDDIQGGPARRSNMGDEVYSVHSEPNLHSPVRPPPGMMGPPGMSNIANLSSSYGSSGLNQNRNSASSTSPPIGGGGGGGYFVGGYDQPDPRSPPWGG